MKTVKSDQPPPPAVPPRVALAARSEPARPDTGTVPAPPSADAPMEEPGYGHGV
jgi:hypothetical protein